MRVRCPHCHQPIELVNDDLAAEVLCSSCGSRFSLTGGNSETIEYVEKHKMLGQFELLERVGMGKFGSVWKARDTQLDRIVAVKMPRKDQLSSAEAEMFFREARTAAQLKHPNIVGVHEVGREEESLFIVSDFVAGANLHEWLSAQRLTPREAAELCAKIADAVAHAHAAGVVHRDLKPGNIMLDADGQPHITDFGLAKREAGEITMTLDGAILGTPAYMSPEQARGEGHTADARSDVYSLGVILFELLTGELPFRGETRMLIVQILKDEPPSPRKLNARVPRDLETICLKCLEKDPKRRYASTTDLSAELRRFLEDEPILARPITRLARAWRWSRRNPLVASLSSALLLILISIATVAPIIAIHQTALREEAEVARAHEAALREQAEARLRIPQADVLLRAGKYADAEKLLSEIPTTAIRPDSLHAGALRILGWWHALHEEWAETASDLKVLTETDEFDDASKTSLDALFYATALVQLNDKVRFDDPRKVLITRFGNTTKPVVAERILRAALFLPSDSDMTQAMVGLRATIARGEQDGALPQEWKRWGCLALAMDDYRRGNYQNSIRWCAKATSSSGQPNLRDSMILTVLAMAYQHLGRTTEARDAFARACSASDVTFGGMSALAFGQDLDVNGVFDSLGCSILLREAASLVGDTASVAETATAAREYSLGRIYAIGDGAEKNLSEAAKWYRKASARGHVLASDELAGLLPLDAQGNLGAARASAELKDRSGSFLMRGFRGSWSPDGKRMVFVPRYNIGELSILEVDSKRVTTLSIIGKDVNWSPGDGKWIAFVKAEPSEEVWVVGPDGKNARRIAEGGWPCWSDNGKTLYFNSRKDRRIMSQVLDEPNAQPKAFADNYSQDFSGPSPDGRYLAIQTGNMFRVVERDSRRIIRNWSIAGWPGLITGWSPDSKLVGISAFGGINGDANRKGVCVLEIATGKVWRLAGSDFCGPSFSNDGHRIVLDWRPKSGPTQIWSVPTKVLETIEPEATRAEGVAPTANPATEKSSEK